jgi:hypothetical protein
MTRAAAEGPPAPVAGALDGGRKQADRGSVSGRIGQPTPIHPIETPAPPPTRASG